MKRFYSVSQRRFTSSVLSAISQGSKSEFESSISSNGVLERLWRTRATLPSSQAKADDVVNASSTLPIVLRTKEAVFHDVAKENASLEGVALKVKQFTTYFKSVIYFYRVGIQNVWRNRKESKLIKERYNVEVVTTGGKVIKRQIRNGKDMVNALVSLENFERVEQEALKVVDPRIVLNITRKEFQTVLRTEKDFFKIPLFALILVIFAEMTPLLCFLVPEITPSTCVFPGLIKKMNKHAITAQETLSKLRKERYYDEYYSKGETLFQSVEKLPDDELRLLAQSLRLTSRYVPIGLYPASILQNRLMDKYNEIKVDNYFLVSSEGQNMWSLNKNELTRACLDRGLIDFTKDDLTHIGSHELRLRLFFFLGMFENEKSIGNVGLFALNFLNLSESVHFNTIRQKDAHELNHWWVEEHKEEIKYSSEKSK